MTIAIVVLAVFLGIALIFLLIFVIRAWLFGKHVVRQFERSNVIVAGKKGKGKDLLFQYVIKKRKMPYYANIPYGGDYLPVKLKEIAAEGNTFHEFLQGKVKQSPRRFLENTDIYISDGGVFLPSFADSILDKYYPEMPPYYALSRHTANHNIHVNVQNFERLWKKLREQADYYILVKKRIILPHFILIKAIGYDKLQSAINALEPVKGRFFNKFSRAERDIYEASNGEIKSGWIIVSKSMIDYDTRAFEPILYGDQKRLYHSSVPERLRKQRLASGATSQKSGAVSPDTAKDIAL